MTRREKIFALRGPVKNLSKAVSKCNPLTNSYEEDNLLRNYAFNSFCFAANQLGANFIKVPPSTTWDLHRKLKEVVDYLQEEGMATVFREEIAAIKKYA